MTFKDLQKLVQSEATQDRVKYFKDSRIESSEYGTKNDTNRKTEQPKAFAASITLLAYQEKTVKENHCLTMSCYCTRLYSIEDILTVLLLPKSCIHSEKHLWAKRLLA